jgi:hypothetical protein
MRKNHAEVLITSTPTEKVRPIVPHTPDPVNIVSRVAGFQLVSPSSSPTNFLFFKHLFNLTPYLVNADSKVGPLSYESPYMASSAERDQFSLDSILKNDTLNVLSSDTLSNGAVKSLPFNQTSLSLLNFFKLSRWLSLFSTSPSEMYRPLGTDLKSPSSLNYFINRESRQQLIFNSIKTPVAGKLLKTRPLYLNLQSLNATALVYNFSESPVLPSELSSFTSTNAGSTGPETSVTKSQFVMLPKHAFWLATAPHLKSLKLELLLHPSNCDIKSVFKTRWL